MPTLREIIAGLPPEQVTALRQEFEKMLASGGGATSEQGRRLLNVPTPSRFGRAALAGITAGGQSIVSDVREMAGLSPIVREGMPISEKPVTEFQRGLLDITGQREERLGKEQELRQKRFKIDNLLKLGGEVGDEEIKETEEVLTQDLTSELEAGRGIPRIDKDTGERKWRILSNQEWQRKIQQGKFDASEIEHLQTIRSENRAWYNVVDRLKEMGIDPSTAGDIEFDVVNSPIGTLSIPARFNLAAQYSQDPRYTAVKRDIELAFQAFRKRVTGAQASDRELKMLRPIIASFKDRPEVFFQTVQNSIENTEIAFNDRLDVYRAAGRDTTQFENFFALREPTGARVGKISSVSGQDNDPLGIR